MAEDHIRYDILAQEALRGVVKKVLTEVAKTGLPGEHHFFISFLTHAPGVRISERLMAQYDKEMTIVMQNQFWELKINDNGFEVGLSFDGQPELLEIPFAAIKGFFDPSVQFGLQFDPEAETVELEAEDDIDGDNDTDGETSASDEDVTIDDTAEENGDNGESGDKVVSLDSFRKKP